MPRSYRNMSMYEEQIMELRKQGYSGREICEKFGFSKKQYENFITRYNRKRRKQEAGIIIRRKGRPSKDFVITEEMKAAELRYVIARKDAKIKQLEMENELMRDFLLLTGRK